MEQLKDKKEIQTMQWQKLGLIIEPNPKYSWMSHYVGPSFLEIIDDKILRIYVSGRDGDNISRVGVVDIDANDMKTILNISEKPILDIGDIGCFDERGASYPWIVDDGDKRYMYYVGWVKGGISGFQNFTGVAVSNDGGKTYQRLNRAPMLGRTNDEPVGSGSVAVMKDKDTWKLWYTSFVKWDMVDLKHRHFYHIKYAESKDGINWDRKGKVAIDFKNDIENTIGKPMPIYEDGKYKLWYSYREWGSTYRLGYAESMDGVTWNRMDDQVGIDVSGSGWDSEMIEYAYVFDHRGGRYMIYNGNSFGKTGLGLARLAK